jgi:hypothetical protein
MVVVVVVCMGWREADSYLVLLHLDEGALKALEP